MKRRKPYVAEFKQEAVKLVTAQGMGVTHIARDVDVRLDTLHRWLRHARSAANPPTTDGVSRADVAQLKRENEQLRMERDSVQKARASFRGCHTEAEVPMCGSPREHVPGYDAMPSAWGRPQWVVCLETPSEQFTHPKGRYADDPHPNHFS